jgi:uncharacterized protein DUF429
LPDAVTSASLAAGETGVVRVTGVDGCRGGWALVEIEAGEEGRGEIVGVRVAGSLGELLTGTASGQVVGIDMPLGLLSRGWRAADAEARRRLGVRRSSIFGIPPASVGEQADYHAALAERRRVAGQGFSIQAWGPRPTWWTRRRWPGPLAGSRLGRLGSCLIRRRSGTDGLEIAIRY